jgi:hypothetical protein
MVFHNHISGSVLFFFFVAASTFYVSGSHPVDSSGRVFGPSQKSPYTIHNKNNRQTSKPSAWFEPAILATKPLRSTHWPHGNRDRPDLHIPDLTACLLRKITDYKVYISSATEQLCNRKLVKLHGSAIMNRTSMLKAKWQLITVAHENRPCHAKGGITRPFPVCQRPACIPFLGQIRLQEQTHIYKLGCLACSVWHACFYYGHPGRKQRPSVYVRCFLVARICDSVKDVLATSLQLHWLSFFRVLILTFTCSRFASLLCKTQINF